MVKFYMFLVFLFTIIITACEAPASNSASIGGSEPEFARSEQRAASNKAAPQSREESTQEKVTLDTADKSQAEPAPRIDRKIIRNAELSLETDAPAEAQRKITAIAEGNGGFVVESVSRGSDADSAVRDTVSMSIRVPSAKFEESLDAIRKTASRVAVETVKGQDVTEEFIDVEARLKTKKALEQQFIEIMKRSGSVEEALNIQRELANVRGEIEQIEGRKRFLENQSSLSTITIMLQTPTAISGSSKGFFYRFTDSASRGIDVALGFVLFFMSALIAVLPFLILVVLPIYLVIRYFRKKEGSNQPAKAKSAGEIVKNEIIDE